MDLFDEDWIFGESLGDQQHAALEGPLLVLGLGQLHKLAKKAVLGTQLGELPLAVLPDQAEFGVGPDGGRPGEGRGGKDLGGEEPEGRAVELLEENIRYWAH